jgi:hypothetical protein
VQIAVGALAPMVPLMLTAVPLKDLGKELVHALL